MFTAVPLPPIAVHLPTLPRASTALEVPASLLRRCTSRASSNFRRAKEAHGGKPYGWVSPNQLAALFLASDYTCAYCGTRLPVSELTLDHRVPLARGGKNALPNLVVACRTCNSRKGQRTESDFAAYIRARYPQDAAGIYAAWLADMDAATAEDDASLPATLTRH
jgi:5-methylcytosine-specific restriction endonuclease McrA